MSEQLKHFGHNRHLVDLTQTIVPGIPAWDLSCGFALDETLNYRQCQSETKFSVHSMATPCGIGTHMDAPRHCFAEGSGIDQITLEQLIAPCCVIDVSDRADADYVVSLEDIKNYESELSIIAPGSFVAIYIGWSRHWHDAMRYHNDYKFPRIGAEAADYLITRDIVGIGVDTSSPDGADHTFPVHRVVLGAGKYIVENLMNLDQLPSTGAQVILLPMKIGEGTEAPVRAIAMVEA